MGPPSDWPGGATNSAEMTAMFSRPSRLSIAVNAPAKPVGARVVAGRGQPPKADALERRPINCIPNEYLYPTAADRTLLGAHLRQMLEQFVAGFRAGNVSIRLPRPQGEVAAGSVGHFHLAPELFLQANGVGRFHFPEGSLELAPGEALIIPARVMHHESIAADSPERPYRNLVLYPNGTELTCHLSREDPCLDADGLRFPSFHHIEAHASPKVRPVHDWLADAARIGWEVSELDTPRARELALGQVGSLLAVVCAGALRLLDQPAGEGGQTEMPLVSMTRIWVRSMLSSQDLSVASLAGKAGCSPDYLSHLFRSSTGERLVSYINRQRMERAAQLMAEGGLSGKEVAWACGFSSHSYFSRVFQQFHGASPSDWRERRS